MRSYGQEKTPDGCGVINTRAVQGTAKGWLTNHPAATTGKTGHHDLRGLDRLEADRRTIALDPMDAGTHLALVSHLAVVVARRETDPLARRTIPCLLARHCHTLSCW